MEPGCHERRKLAEDFALAARLYAEAAVKLALSREGYSRLSQITKDAQTRSVASYEALEEHIARHRCQGCGTSDENAAPATERLKVFPKSWTASGGDMPLAEPACAPENAPGPGRAKSAGNA
jgi:hypothetical protein